MSTKKINNIKVILERLKFAKNLNTWRDVAAYLGEHEATISIWRKRNSPSALEKILYRAKGDVRDTWLLTGEGPMLEGAEMKGGLKLKGAMAARSDVPPPEPSNVEPYQDRLPLRRVPLISWVQAGGFVDPDCQTTPGYAERYEETAATASPSAFALVVKGDSMEPEFTEGDIIIVDPDRRVVHGSYIIAKNGTEATFKQFVEDGSSVFFKPLNSRYPIMNMTGIDFRVVGVVVEKRKRY